MNHETNVNTHTLESLTDALALPNTNTLATLAAQPRFAKLNNGAAIHEALNLWQEAQAVLTCKQNYFDASYRNYQLPLRNLREPKKWPASFADFLKIIVQGKDTGEQLKRFRGYLQWTIKQLDSDISDQFLMEETGKRLHEYQQSTFSKLLWREHALSFRRYWGLHTTQVKKEAGRKGGITRVKNEGP